MTEVNLFRFSDGLYVSTRKVNGGYEVEGHPMGTRFFPTKTNVEAVDAYDEIRKKYDKEYFGL